MAGECSTALALHGHLFAEAGLVGLQCARCGEPFRAGDPLRAFSILVAYDDQVARRATVLAHHDCTDPGCERLVH